MNTTTNTVANTTNDIGMIASLAACAALSMAIIANAFAAPALPTQKMDTIVVTAQRLSVAPVATITFEPIVITAKRLAPTQMAQITLDAIVVTAQRIAV